MCFARKFDMNIDDQIVSLIKNNVGVNKWQYNLTTNGELGK